MKMFFNDKQKGLIKMSHRIDVSIKDLNDVQNAFFEQLVSEHGNKSAAVKYMIDTLIKGNEKPTMRNATHDKIHQFVCTQMLLNANTKKTIRIGTGDNAVDVKYEQRTITPKWIQEKVGATQQACLEYISQHQAEIEKHHKEVLGLTDSKLIQNFNRRTGKASKRVVE
jgi:hypothetical protein